MWFIGGVAFSEAYKRGRIKKQKYKTVGFGGIKRPF